MRRFIYAVMLSGALAPAMASAQTAPAAPAAPGGGTTPTASAPSNGNGNGTTTPSTDTNSTAQGASVQSATPAPLPWRGTSFIFDQSISAETIAPGATQTYMPSYQWWISFRPRWAITPNLTASARQDVTLEWTNQASTTTYHELQWGDLWTDLSYRGLPTFWGIKAVVGVRAQWPISLASRARGTYFTLGGIVSFSRAFENVGRNGSLSISLAFVGSHPFTQYTSGGGLVVQRNPDGSLDPSRYGCMVAARPGDAASESTNFTTCDYQDASMNTAFSLATMLTIGYQTPHAPLSFSAMVLLSNAWLYGTPDTVLHDPMAGRVEVARAADDNRMRQSSWVLISADYEVQKWLSLSVGYYSARSVLDPSGSYGNPFYSPGGGSRLFLTATVPIDALYNTIAGREARGGGSGGTSRGVTMNETRPRRRWSPNDAARELRERNAANGAFF